MVNMDNFAIATGRLTKDPMVMENQDGSKKIRITVAATNTYRNSKTGERDCQYIPLEAFIPAETAKKGIGAYALMHAGDKISVCYSIRNNNYTDKTTGKQVYGLTLQIESVKLQESKSVTDARHAAKMAAASAEPEVPAMPIPDVVPEVEGIPEGACESIE